MIDFERQLAGIMVREDNMTGTFVALEKVRNERDRIFTSSFSGKNILAVFRVEYFAPKRSTILLKVDVGAPLGPDWTSWQDFFNDIIADTFADDNSGNGAIYFENHTRVSPTVPSARFRRLT